MYTMEYDSVVKKSKIIEFAVKLLELETIILGEVAQTKKDKHVVSHTWMPALNS